MAGANYHPRRPLLHRAALRPLPLLLPPLLLILLSAAPAKRAQAANRAPPLGVQPNRQAYIEGLGNLQGSSCGSYNNVTMYLGVPYALPPVGVRRFAPPAIWTAPYPFPARQAVEQPPRCMQPRKSEYDVIKEDCLYMNIFTPYNASLESIAVRVMFHGGWFYEGSASDTYLQGCKSVALTNTTLVVVQYRLGPFGFLSHPSTFAESETTGNWGLMDQQMALVWIQQYIRYFGGNSSVTIMGQNAGSVSVALHMVSPASAGLFTSAVMDNGAPVKLFTQNQAFDTTAALAAKLKCPENPQEMLSCLRNASAADILENTPFVKDMHRQTRRLFWPVVDGKIVPQQPLDLMATSQFNPASVLVVLNRDEGRTWVAKSYGVAAEQKGNIWTLTAKDVEKFVSSVFWGVNPEQIITHYWVKNYKNVFEQLSDIWTDVFINCPTLKMMQALADYEFPPLKPCPKNSPFFQGNGQPCIVPINLYSFEHRPTCPAQTAYLGASSGRELEYALFLESQYTGCPMDKAEQQLAWDTTYAFGTMASKGMPTFLNESRWALWNPMYQTTMIGDVEEGLNYQTRDLVTKCAVFDNLVLPPTAAPLVPVLTPNAYPIRPGFPLGIRGELPSPPPPAAPSRAASGSAGMGSFSSRWHAAAMTLAASALTLLGCLCLGWS